MGGRPPVFLFPLALVAALPARAARYTTVATSAITGPVLTIRTTAAAPGTSTSTASTPTRTTATVDTGCRCAVCQNNSVI